MARQFIADITPYFHARPIVYVDCGAHTGKILRALVEADLELREAHLIEPNPTAFAELSETAAQLSDRIHRVRLHNVALGAEPGRVRMSDAGSMSRVLARAEASEAGSAETGFIADCVTLDSLAWDFIDGRVSILKIDVEGSEPEVLKGAANLLSRQAIDVIYIEAGLSAGSIQQSYYRVLEDLLAGYGYRIFRFYEQTHDWTVDSPFLRRADLGFMSERFAAANPHRLSRELYRLRQEKSKLAEEGERVRAEANRGLKEVEAASVRVAVAQESAAAANAALGAAQTALAALTRDLTAAESQASEARAERDALAREHARLLDYARSLERRYAEILVSNSWRALEPARWLSRWIKRRNPPTTFTPRLGAASPSGKVLAQEDSQGDAKVLRLDEKLWGGFSAAALADLKALASDGSRSKGQRAEAFFALARWSHSHGDIEGALAAMQSMRTVDKRKVGLMRAILLEADCLMHLERAAEARALLEEAHIHRPLNNDLHLALANTLLGPDGTAAPGTDADRLARINRIYVGAGLAPLSLHDSARPLLIDNLTTGPVAPETATEVDPAYPPKISVIMPVYAAAETLRFALRGLLAQSWGNLEIVIADDCSPDDTVAVAEAIAAEDARVKVVRQTENRGSYAARNAALKVVTGDFVTTHDADDWSHPQKLALQARFMAENPDVQGCFSDWVRVASNMRAGWLFRPWGGYSSKNMSSIFLRRSAMEALGGWDPVRVGGDTDLLRRAEALFGKNAIQRVRRGVPLAFALHTERSLTRASATHVRTMLHGVRREYDEAGAFWRQTLQERGAEALAALRFSPDAAGPRPFPAPALILGEPPQDYDLIFVSDFALKGGAFVSTLNAIEAATRAGMSVGVVHWRRHDLDVKQELNPALRRLAQEGVIRVIAPGETARAGTVIVGYPVVLRTPMDLFPKIETDRLIVVVNQMAERLYSGKDPQYDPLELRARLRETFGTEGLWAPISGLVQRLMRADPRYPAPSRTIWTPLADAAAWCATPPRWRGAGGRAPVIGRHARDHYTKWPTTPEALRAAYCADRPCKVEIMGGAAWALGVMGAQPANWTVHPFGAMGARTFLRRLDAFVHYPHEDYIEEFGRAVLEAIALGLPAVLPPVFRESFGDAALYAEPADVWDTISALWADEAAWLAQGRAGQDFVRANSDWSLFPARLKATLAEADASPAADETAVEAEAGRIAAGAVQN